jgi:hypothetical protein
MQWFNAHVTVDRVFGDHEDELLARLEGFHPAPSAWSDGRLSARISLSAGSMIDAAAQALALLQEATGADPVALELMTEREFRNRQTSTTRSDRPATPRHWIGPRARWKVAGPRPGLSCSPRDARAR